ncbi:uncharacterized protein LOC110914385 [Helianthus annuus]|uniref:uncharacterized protein LOC110914385 n=1 Tax=Helianthus annuus TaxID=4232 RepID=UPI000B8F0325|nr:uncharacterized protein LOC110914385 [Helianthus annuus]
MEALKKFNPGTIVEWCVLRRTGVEQVEFRRVFWAFNPSILGFKHCRLVISIDATHLYGKYKGKLMIAMGVDGNNQILPLAFAIVENESYASWSWFLSHVKKHVVKDTKGICLISDRHAGILKAVRATWYCLRHFINNFNDKFHNSQLKALAYRAGSQNQIRKFNSIMEEIGKINRKARQWLEQQAFDRWTFAHDGGKRYGLLITNLSEIFNSVLKGARFLPITSCVQLTFYRLVHYFDVRRPMGSNAQANGDMYTPHILAKQASSMSKAGAHSLRYFNRQKGIFEVITQKGKNVQVVVLDKKNLHVRAGKSCLIGFNGSLTTRATQISIASPNYCATWSSEFRPLPHEAYWPNSSSIGELLLNSELKLDKKGRPRSTRLRNGMDIKERKKANLCGICKQRGHNRAMCPLKA